MHDMQVWDERIAKMVWRGLLKTRKPMKQKTGEGGDMIPSVKEFNAGRRITQFDNYMCDIMCLYDPL